MQDPGADILPGQLRRAQVLAVGHQEAKKGGGGIGDGNEPHIAPEALRVLYNKKHTQDKQQDAPAVIGDDEILAEGDIVVDDRLGGPVIVGDHMLHNKIQNEVHRQIQTPPHMGMGFDEVLDFLHEYPPTLMLAKRLAVCRG